MFSGRFITKKIFRRFFSSKISGGKTGLYDFHVENGGKMVNFGGCLLPVQYSDMSITASHLHTRKKVSIFDVSHMLQTEIRGQSCIQYLESTCTADLKNLHDNSSTLTVFTNDKGGILDDLIVTKISDDHFYLVSNAGMKEQDQKILTDALANHKKQNPNSNIKIEFLSPEVRGLIALQGPKAAETLQKLTDIDITKLYFMMSTIGQVADVDNCRITRCGYTGEDGFEISMPTKNQVEITRKLLSQDDVKMAGLGARDSLRLEAGLCLYGSDIDQLTTPVEAGLTWLVAKSRRKNGDFPGAENILNHIINGPLKKRVGIICNSGPPARHGTIILDENQSKIGEITSGCPSPSLNKNISMGYVPTDYSKIKTKVLLLIREKYYEGTITKMPFVTSNYYVKPKLKK